VQYKGLRLQKCLPVCSAFIGAICVRLCVYVNRQLVMAFEHAVVLLLAGLAEGWLFGMQRGGGGFPVR
jgi:hypothetical protein